MDHTPSLRNSYSNLLMAQELLRFFLFRNIPQFYLFIMRSCCQLWLILWIELQTFNRIRMTLIFTIEILAQIWKKVQLNFQANSLVITFILYFNQATWANSNSIRLLLAFVSNSSYTYGITNTVEYMSRLQTGQRLLK